MTATNNNPLQLGVRHLAALRFLAAHGPRDIAQTPTTRWMRAKLLRSGLIQIVPNKLRTGSGLVIALTERGRSVLRQNQTAQLPAPTNPGVDFL